jgi:hypothetical protein
MLSRWNLCTHVLSQSSIFARYRISESLLPNPPTLHAYVQTIWGTGSCRRNNRLRAYLSSSPPLSRKRLITHSHFKEMANHTAVKNASSYRKWAHPDPNPKYSLHDRDASTRGLVFHPINATIHAWADATSACLLCFLSAPLIHVSRMKGTIAQRNHTRAAEQRKFPLPALGKLLYHRRNCGEENRYVRSRGRMLDSQGRHVSPQGGVLFLATGLRR